MITSTPAAQAIAISDEHIKKIAAEVARILLPYLSTGSSTILSSGKEPSFRVNIDESTIDVGVSTEGMVTNQPLVESTSTKSDDLQTIKEKLKALKGK